MPWMTRKQHAILVGVERFGKSFQHITTKRVKPDVKASRLKKIVDWLEKNKKRVAEEKHPVSMDCRSQFTYLFRVVDREWQYKDEIRVDSPIPSLSDHDEPAGQSSEPPANEPKTDVEFHGHKFDSKVVRYCRPIPCETCYEKFPSLLRAFCGHYICEDCVTKAESNSCVNCGDEIWLDSGVPSGVSKSD